MELHECRLILGRYWKKNWKVSGAELFLSDNSKVVQGALARGEFHNV